MGGLEIALSTSRLLANTRISKSHYPTLVGATESRAPIIRLYYVSERRSAKRTVHQAFRAKKNRSHVVAECCCVYSPADSWCLLVLRHNTPTTYVRSEASLPAHVVPVVGESQSVCFVAPE